MAQYVLGPAAHRRHLLLVPRAGAPQGMHAKTARYGAAWCSVGPCARRKGRRTFAMWRNTVRQADWRLRLPTIPADWRRLMAKGGRPQRRRRTAAARGRSDPHAASVRLCAPLDAKPLGVRFGALCSAALAHPARVQLSGIKLLKKSPYINSCGVHPLRRRLGTPGPSTAVWY